MLKEVKAVHRGCIYEFMNTHGERVFGRYALVVGAEDRSEESLISILLLSEFRGYNRDVVKVRIRGVSYFAHCGLVSFCRRYQLGKVIDRCDPTTMARIDAQIPVELGLAPKSREEYEALYNDLLRTLEGKGDE